MWRILVGACALLLIACTVGQRQAKAAVTQNEAVPLRTTISNSADITKMTLVRNKVSDEAKDALINLYGGVTWKSKNIGEFFKGKKKGYISPKFEGRFTEGGRNKLLVLGYITPAPIESYFCHACLPLIGGAIFRQKDSRWVVEAAQKIIGWGDVFETGNFDLIQIGPDKYGVLIHVSDSHQGYEDSKFEILVPYNGHITIALDAGYIEKPGPAACIDDNINMPQQDLKIKFEAGKRPEYFDVIVQAKYNDGNCQGWTRKAEIKRYQFNNGKFKPI